MPCKTPFACAPGIGAFTKLRAGRSVPVGVHHISNILNTHPQPYSLPTARRLDSRVSRRDMFGSEIPQQIDHGRLLEFAQKTVDLHALAINKIIGELEVAVQKQDAGVFDTRLNKLSLAFRRLQRDTNETVYKHLTEELNVFKLCQLYHWILQHHSGRSSWCSMVEKIRSVAGLLEINLDTFKATRANLSLKGCIGRERQRRGVKDTVEDAVKVRIAVEELTEEFRKWTLPSAQSTTEQDYGFTPDQRDPVSWYWPYRPFEVLHRDFSCKSLPRSSPPTSLAEDMEYLSSLDMTVLVEVMNLSRSWINDPRLPSRPPVTGSGIKKGTHVADKITNISPTIAAGRVKKQTKVAAGTQHAKVKRSDRATASDLTGDFEKVNILNSSSAKIHIPAAHDHVDINSSRPSSSPSPPAQAKKSTLDAVNTKTNILRKNQTVADGRVKKNSKAAVDEKIKKVNLATVDDLSANLEQINIRKLWSPEKVGVATVNDLSAILEQANIHRSSSPKTPITAPLKFPGVFVSGRKKETKMSTFVPKEEEEKPVEEDGVYVEVSLKLDGLLADYIGDILKGEEYYDIFDDTSDDALFGEGLFKAPQSLSHLKTIFYNDFFRKNFALALENVCESINDKQTVDCDWIQFISRSCQYIALARTEEWFSRRELRHCEAVWRWSRCMRQWLRDHVLAISTRRDELHIRVMLSNFECAMTALGRPM